MPVSSQTTVKAAAKRKAPASDIAAPAAAAATAADKARKRRQRRGTVEERGRGYEYADMNDDTGPEPTTGSDQGAGRLGFTGTARREARAEAAGLTTLLGDEFGGGPSEPMLPGTWEVGDDEG